jgi:hypothetical protein
MKNGWNIQSHFENHVKWNAAAVRVHLDLRVIPGAIRRSRKNVPTKVTHEVYKLETLTYLTRGDIKGPYVCTPPYNSKKQLSITLNMCKLSPNCVYTTSVGSTI